jgi:hypothetical protein
MTPKDKAIELYNKYEQLGRDFTRGVSMKEFAKECALIGVDEIFKTGLLEGSTLGINKKYWQEVKQEIEAL